MGVISSRNPWTSETHFQHPQTGVSVLLTAVLQHQAGWSPRGGRHRFGSAARGELQCTRLECRTAVICPENGSFLGEDCAGWCQGSGWWKRQAARGAGAAGQSGPALWPRLLAAPRPAFAHIRHRSPFPSPFRKCYPGLCRQPRAPKPCQRLGASLVFPTESAARAATVRGARVDSGHCIWGRTIGWCGLAEQGRSGKLLPGDGDGARAEGQWARSLQGRRLPAMGTCPCPEGAGRHRALRKHSRKSWLRRENPHAHRGGPRPPGQTRNKSVLFSSPEKWLGEHNTIVFGGRQMLAGFIGQEKTAPRAWSSLVKLPPQVHPDPGRLP